MGGKTNKPVVEALYRRNYKTSHERKIAENFSKEKERGEHGKFNPTTGQWDESTDTKPE